MGVPHVEPERWYGCYVAPRDGLFTRESNRHPAKMAVGLAVRILEHGEKQGYWKKGDTLLDPMAGIGTTLVLAAALGYEAVGVELETHFVELASANIAQASRKFDPRGACRILQGDARDLSVVLAEAVVTSPPYPTVFREEHSGTAGGKAARESQRGGSFRGYSGGVTSPPYADQAVVARAGMTARILREAKEHGIEAAVKLYRETVIDRQKAHGRWSDENIRSHIEAALATRESGYSAIVTSPPYGDTLMPGMVSARIRQLARAGKWEEAISALRTIDRTFVAKKKRRAPHSDAYLRQAIEYALERDAGNYGARAPDAVVTTPPFANSEGQKAVWKFRDAAAFAAEQERRYRSGEMRGHPASSEAIMRDMERQSLAVSMSPAQIGNLRDPQGDVDAILCSPPWQQQAAQQTCDRGKGFHSYGPNEPKDRMKKDYLRGGTAGQVGSLCDPDGGADAVLTSPPYMDTMSPAEARGRPSSGWVERKRIPHNLYGKTEGQIGNSNSKETYCRAMLRVYQQMHAVLKPRAVVCLVTKNPVRNGQIRRLDDDTIRLMNAAGFMLIERVMAMLTEDKGTQLVLDGSEHKIRIERKSFFKRLYERTHPELRVDHEDVLYFRRA